MKFNEYIEMLLESTINESRRIDRELKKGPVKHNDITFHAKIKNNDRDDRLFNDNSVGYVATKKGEHGVGYVVFEKATTHAFKEYIDGLLNLIEKVKEIKTLITGKETDKEIQKIWSMLDDIGLDNFSFKDFVKRYSLNLEKHMSKDGWNKDIIQLITEFIEDTEMSFTDLRDSLSENGMTNENIKEFMNSSSYKKLLLIRKFSEKMNSLNQTVVAANKYAATRKNIEKLSKTMETLETEANTLAKQITK